ncbi:MAG: NDP-sugar synthase [Gemmatimonadales bacterium]
MTSPSLVLLAAGMGSRYGGLKQLDPVGPHGETLMDYSIHDALRAGFDRVVFVIRPEIEREFLATIGNRYRNRLAVGIAHQRLDAIPADLLAPVERTRPWGTGQAVLAAQGMVEGGFAVANADDFYGRPAFEALAAFLSAPGAHDASAHAVVGFRLRHTLSPSGTVNRALCRTDQAGWLTAIEEVFGISADGEGRGRGVTAGRPAVLEADDLVSMNLWGLRPSVFEPLREEFERFLRSAGAAQGEYYLPTAVESLIRAERARVRLLAPDSPWFGLSHAADRPIVVRKIRELIEQGTYPEHLWK